MQLVKYDAAKLAIAEAKSVDEAKEICDVAEAMKAYARMSKDRQMEIDASEIRIRAERRLGEMIAEQKRTVGLNPGVRTQGGGDGAGGAMQEPPADRPTLADAGIDKKLSSRSQQIAAIPEADFENTLAEHREQQQAITAKTMEKLAKQGKEVEEKEIPEVDWEAGSMAMTYARMSISQLERIHKEDKKRAEALVFVAQWIDNNK
jgi:hypothetical protein